MMHKEKAKIIANQIQELIPSVEKMQELKRLKANQSSCRNEIEDLLHKMLFYSQKIKKPKIYPIIPSRYYDAEVRLSDTFGLRYKHRQSRLSTVRMKTEKDANGNVFAYHLNRDYNGNVTGKTGAVIKASDFKPEMLERWCELVDEVNNTIYSYDGQNRTSDSEGTVVSVKDANGKEIPYQISSSSIRCLDEKANLSYWENDISAPFSFLSHTIGNVRNKTEIAFSQMESFFSYMDTLIENFDTIQTQLFQQGKIEEELKNKIEKAIAPQLLLEEIKGRKE